MPSHIDRIRLLEDLGADAWPAATAERLQGWRLCLDAGVTRRANSVLPNAAAPVNEPETLIDEVERRYRARGLMPCFKLTVAAQPADLDDRLGRRGYRAEGHSLVLTGDAGEGMLHAPHDAISLYDRPDRTWLDACWPAASYAAERAARQAIVERIRPPRAFALACVGGAPAGAALAVADHGWTCLTAVHVLPEQRRRGVARALLAALAGWASAQGAQHLYLQVERDNEPARRLYAGLGFEEAYRYHYRRAAA